MNIKKLTQKYSSIARIFLVYIFIISLSGLGGFSIYKDKLGSHKSTELSSDIGSFKPDRACSISGLDRGHKFLLEYGIQLVATFVKVLNTDMCKDITPPPVPVPNLDNWRKSNFTTLGFFGDNLQEWFHGDYTPSLPWFKSISDFPETDKDYEKLKNMIMADVWSEKCYEVNNPDCPEAESNLREAGKRLKTLREELPKVISYTVHRCWGSGGDGAILKYMKETKPDMLYWFDYRFGASNRCKKKHEECQKKYKECQKEYYECLKEYCECLKEEWPYPGGSPTLLYYRLGMYRYLSMKGNDNSGTRPIPAGVFIQTHIPLNETGHIISESELNIQYFSAWVYGYKSIHAFTYTNPPYPPGYCHEKIPSIFFSEAWDSKPTELFYRVAELNKQSRNLGPTLIRLLSMCKGDNYEGPYFVLGKHKIDENTKNNQLPHRAIDFNSDNVQKPVNYIQNVSAVNLSAQNQTTYNDGLPGDVIIGFFLPLLEEFDGPNYIDEIYFMIVNGLTDPEATGAQTKQTITIDFDFSQQDNDQLDNDKDKEINSLMKLNRKTGYVDKVELTPIGNSKYRLILCLDGGMGELFKFNTDAPFVHPAWDINNKCDKRPCTDFSCIDCGIR